VHLSDRNVWITAVREDRQIRTPASPTGPGTQQGANPR